MSTPSFFSVYEHKLITKDKRLVTRNFICLTMSDGTRIFTDFHKYAKNPRRRIKRIDENGNKRCYYIAKLLNYSFFYKGMRALSDIDMETVREFLNSYGRCELPDDDENVHRSKQSVEKCVNTIMDFLELLISDKKAKCKLKTDDLYKFIDYRDKTGRMKKKKVPVFDIVYTGSKRQIFRDIPNKVFEIIFSHIAVHHTDLLALVALSAFGGLRPSESCNVRRTDSLLGPGIIFTYVDGEIIRAEIDLRKEYVLRSDMLPTGKIKKERMQVVPDIFLHAFVEAYDMYMKHIENQKYEQDYGALTVNKQGKALTYDSYYIKFQKIIRDEITPILLADDDPEVAIYGRMLLEHKLSPHVFRHWYTVQLVLSGVSEPGILMKYRGDTSPESSIVYINGKSELQKLYRKVNNEAFSYMLWAASNQKEK